MNSMDNTNNTSVKIFTQPGCPACSQLKAFLKSKGVNYSELDVSSDENAMRELHERGYSATPLTVVGDTEILGMNKARLEASLPRPAEA